jgi:hypothetical protein
MPLGNLTSQIFCNIYLDKFDHFVKETLKIKSYIRYVDDMVFFVSSKQEANELFQVIKKYLNEIGLIVHPHKFSIFPTSKPISFLGFLIHKHHISAGKHIRKGYHKAIKQSKYKNNQNQIVAYKAQLSHTGSIHKKNLQTPSCSKKAHQDRTLR